MSVRFLAGAIGRTELLFGENGRTIDFKGAGFGERIRSLVLDILGFKWSLAI